MRLTIREVTEQLGREGLAGPDEINALRSAVARDMDDDMPWYMRVAVGLGAWAATAFLLAFLFGVDLLDGDMARMLYGIMLVAAALWYRREAGAEFMRHATVAASLAGIGLIIVGTGAITDSGVMAGVVGLIVSIATIVLMADRVHRFLSTLIAAGCAMVIALDLEKRAGLEIIAILLLLATALVWRTGLRERSAATADMLEPVGYGLVVAVFAVILYSAATGRKISPLHSATAGLGIATTLTTGALLLALVSSILREHRLSLASPAALVVLGAIVVVSALTRSSPGIIAGIAVLVLGFDRRNPLLVGIATLFVTVFGSVYYYSLTLTLMEKAGVLAATGVVLLLARVLLAHVARSDVLRAAGGAA